MCIRDRLAWGYGRKVREESLLSRGWAYYVGSTVIFATGAGLSIAGMRGGMTTSGPTMACLLYTSRCV